MFLYRLSSRPNPLTMSWRSLSFMDPGQTIPDFPPPKERSAAAFFRVMPRARSWMISGVMSASIRVPPMAGTPMARLSTTRYPPISRGLSLSHIQETNLGPSRSTRIPSRWSRSTSRGPNSRKHKEWSVINRLWRTRSGRASSKKVFIVLGIMMSSFIFVNMLAKTWCVKLNHYMNFIHFALNGPIKSRKIF